MSLAALPADDRTRTYRALTRRNRWVAVLRWAVPAFGLAIVAGLCVETLLYNLSTQFGFANLRIDRDKLVVDLPSLTSTTANGNSYSLKADEAHAQIGALNVIEVSGAQFSFKAAGRDITATLPVAQIQTDKQVVTVNGVTEIKGSDGLQGSLTNIVWDVPTQRLETHGPVELTMPDGSHVRAESLSYDGKAETWTYAHVEFTIAGLAGDTE